MKKKVFSSYVELVGYVCDGDKVYEATELFEVSCVGLVYYIYARLTTCFWLTFVSAKQKTEK